jgi:hypothetical protein
VKEHGAIIHRLNSMIANQLRLVDLLKQSCVYLINLRNKKEKAYDGFLAINPSNDKSG